METVTSFAQRWGDSSADHFLEAFPEPILHVVAAPGSGNVDAFQTYVGPVGGAPASCGRVFPLRKRSRNPFQDMITIGRAENNDIVLPFPEVSKFHAFFLRDGSSGWRLVDAGSTNGTFLNGVALEPRINHRLALGPGSSVELAFGSLACSLMDPSDAWRWVTSLARAAHAA